MAVCCGAGSRKNTRPSSSLTIQSSSSRRKTSSQTLSAAAALPVVGSVPSSDVKCAETEIKTVFKPKKRNPTDSDLDTIQKEYESRVQQAEALAKDGEEVEVAEFLVASGVTLKWFEAKKLRLKMRLDIASGDLFLVSFPKRKHAGSHAQIVFDAVGWARKFSNLLTADDARSFTFAGQVREPDVSFTPGLPWDVNDTPPKVRVLIEIADGNRTVTELRRYGHDFLTSSHYARAFVSVKCHNYTNIAGCGAVAVIWNKVPAGAGHAIPAAAPVAPAVANVPVGFDPLQVWPAPIGPAAIGALLAAAAPAAAAATFAGGGAAPAEIIQCYLAKNFGTIDVAAATETSYTRAAVAGELPSVLPFPAHLGAAPPAALGVAPPAPPLAWRLPIPSADIVYLVRDVAGNLVFLTPPPVGGTNDLEVDLTEILRKFQPGF